MSFLDNRYYDELIKEMQPLFDEQKFVLAPDGAFKNDSYAIKVEYDQERQMYMLNLADASLGDDAEYATVSSWLFDDSQNANDAASVGIDFSETLREKLGIKVTKKTVSKIDLPSKATKDGNITIEGFSKKLLDIYTPLKEAYKQHVSTYGNFLYLDFFTRSVAPLVKNALAQNNKKSVKKLYDALEDAYIHGDKDTTNATVAILATVCYKDDAMKERIKNFLSENSHFSSSVFSFISVLESNKKLQKALIK